MKKVSRIIRTVKRRLRFHLFIILLMTALALSACSPKASGRKSEIIFREYPEFTTEDSSETNGETLSLKEYLASIGITMADEPEDSSEPSSEDISAAEGESGSENTGDAQPGDGSVSSGTSDSETKEFKVYFIDVGQGDSSLIICDGHSMLIDGGPSSQAGTVTEFLLSRGITHLDYIVATHPDEDHIGGLAAAVSSTTVDKVLSAVSSDNRESFKAFAASLSQQDVSITVPSAGDVFSLGSASVTVLGPVHTGSNDNNNSLVLRIVHGENSLLFAADAEQLEEKDILESGATVKSTVLKVGNHGASSSNSSDWLKAVQPSVAVISCGADNEYGHPTASVLDYMKSNNVKLYRTDLQGFLKVTEEDGKLMYRIAKNASIDVFVPGVSLSLRPEGSN